MPSKPKICPRPTPAPADEAIISEELREGQKVYLLLQLLDADDQTLTRGEANKFRDLRKAARTSLNFVKAAAANYRRERLAEQNLVKITPGRSIRYTLLPNGRDYLAASTRHLANVEFTIKGNTLNALIAAAQDSPFRSDLPKGSTDLESAVPSSPTLVEAVLAEFDNLHRERYGRSGLVPIHEIRQCIGQRFGSQAARHEVLDGVILSLWRQKRIGLEGISDLGSATEQQLNDSIPGEGNMLFYLEVPRGQPVLA